MRNIRRSLILVACINMVCTTDKVEYGPRFMGDATVNNNLLPIEELEQSWVNVQVNVPVMELAQDSANSTTVPNITASITTTESHSIPASDAAEDRYITQEILNQRLASIQEHNENEWRNERNNRNARDDAICASVAVMEGICTSTKNQVNGLGKQISGLDQIIAGTNQEMSGLETQMNGLTSQVSGMTNKFAGFDKKLNGVIQGVTVLNNRLTGVENRLTGVENRLTGVENRLTGVETELREFRLEMQKNREEDKIRQDKQFNELRLEMQKKIDEGVQRMERIFERHMAATDNKIATTEQKLNTKIDNVWTNTVHLVNNLITTVTATIYPSVQSLGKWFGWSSLTSFSAKTMNCVGLGPKVTVPVLNQAKDGKITIDTKKISILNTDHQE